LNRSFYKDLARLPDEIWQGDNIVLFTGIMQHQLIGMARFLRERKSFVEAKVVCQLMFDPSWLPWGALARRGTSLYRAAFRLLKPQIGKTVFFTTENEHLERVYKTRFGVKPGLLPIPLCGARECKPPDAPIQVGFFGYSKTEKGFHLLPEAIKQCLAARPDLQFRVQIQHHENEPETIAADQALRQIPTLQVFDGDLSADDFAAATAPLDVMLLPYNQTFFGTRGSGLYIESISAGRLIVAAEGIWAARGIEAGDAVGIVFSPYTSEALAHALLRLCSNFNESRALARAKAAAHARANSIEAYVEALFNITVGSTTGPQTDKPSPS